MILMTLDHARDFAIGAAIGDPVRVETTTVAMFITRWLSHFCAPGFILLAGVSVALQVSRGLSPSHVQRNLVVRGLVLVLLELTVVNFAWSFNPAYPMKYLQVIWAIGLAMVCLAILLNLAPRWVGLIGLMVVVGHNALDQFHAEPGGFGFVMWSILHEKNVLDTGLGFSFRTTYPVLPAVGLMAVGYWLGTAYRIAEPERRQRLFVALGGGCLVIYALLRLTNAYGDPHPFEIGSSASQTLMSFFNPTKYPLSLQFMLMTVGPLLFVLAAFEYLSPANDNLLLRLGQVPMFYYLAHLFVVRSLPLVIALLAGYPLSSFDLFGRLGGRPEDFAIPLWGVYVLAGSTLIVLLPALRPYARLRRTHGGILRYL